MRNIARLSDNDRRELFRNTADKMGLNDAIVEKDFWVCFTLDYLFHRSPWKESITFKGGTSLSKAFHLISRFSEDLTNARFLKSSRDFLKTVFSHNPAPDASPSTLLRILSPVFSFSYYAYPFRQNEQILLSELSCTNVL